MFGRDRSKNSQQDIEEAKKAVQADPEDIRALHRLGDLYSKAEQIDKALETYLQVARRHAEEDGHSKAIAVYKQALKLRAGQAEVHRGIGASSAAIQRTSDALENYQMASHLHERAGLLGSALDVIQEALDVMQESATLWARLAALHALRGDSEEAVLAYEEALQLAEAENKWADCLLLAEQLLVVSPEHLGAFRLAAFAALERKDAMRALAWLRKAFRIHRHDEVILEMMADAFALIGQTQKTFTLLTELAQKYEKNDDPDTAREFYERILTIDPNHIETKRALLALSNVEADWGFDVDSAIEIGGFDPLQSDDTYESIPTINISRSSAPYDSGIFPASTTTSPDATNFDELLDQAQTCLKYDVLDRTAELLQQILTQAPSHTEARKLHAQLLVQQGSVEEAASVWFALANEASDSHQAQMYLEMLLAIEGVSRDIRSIASNMLRQFQYAPPTTPHSV